MSKKVSEHRKSFRKSIVAEAISVAVMATMISTPAFSAEEKTEEEKTEVIYVTATKKSETLQEVPLAMTALTGDFIEKVRLTDVKDLIAYSPGVSGNSSNSFLDSISVRGVRTEDYGAGGDASLGFFKNDQYEGRTGSAISTLFDMDRAEVVNGPQGFLFGRNAIGGAVSVHTARAEIDFFDADLNVDLGSYGLIKVDGSVNVPVNDSFAMRFAGLYHTEESYVDNMVEDQPLRDTDVTALRWSTTYQNDDLSIYTMVEYEDRQGPGGMYRAVDEGEVWDAYHELWGLDQRGDARDVDMNTYWGLRDETEVLNLQVRIEQELDFADITFNAGYKDHDYFYGENWIPSRQATGSWAVDQDGDYAQAELRLNSKSEGPFSWYVGTSLYKENLNHDVFNATSDDFMCAYYNASWGLPSLSQSPTGHCQNFYDNLVDYMGEYYTAYYYPNLPNSNREDGMVIEKNFVKGVNTGWAAFASLAYQITDTVDVEFGVRYTDDTKEFSSEMTNTGYSGGYSYGVSNTTAEPIAAKQSWDDTTFKYLIRWKPADDMMLYASYTEGFKSGGFTTGEFDGVSWGQYDVTNADASVPTFEPEFVESIEIGYKDTWFEDTDVRFTLYSYDYFGLQVSERSDEGAGTVIKNSGLIEATGIEAATNTTLTDNWNFMMNFHYMDSKASGIQGQCDYGDIPAEDGGFEDCEGSKIYWAPEFSGAMVLNGYFPLESGAAVTTSIQTYWESEYTSGYTVENAAVVDASQTWNAHIGYESKSNWYVEAYVDNLTDEVNFDSSYSGGEGVNGTGAGAYPAVYWATWKPRSFGIRFGMTWE
mgnify:CR=1 FL=1